MLHRAWTTGDETFYLVQALNIVGTDKWKSLQQYGAEEAHALFDYDRERDCYWLRDLSAKGGVRVNGIPISKTEPVRLKSGDRVSFARSPEYTFLAPPLTPAPRISPRGRREHSFDEGVIMENGDYGNLAVDSAPSVNGVATLPRLDRGRSPSARRALTQLPVATLIDGHRVEDGKVVSNGDAVLVKSARHSPTMLTYRQRHFLRHASVDSSVRVSPGRVSGIENRRRIITHAWSEVRDGKYAAANSSPSSSESYPDGVHATSNRRGSTGNGSAFLRTQQSHVIRQLQKRVQQLEEALRIQTDGGTLLIHAGDSGISSAASALGNATLLAHLQKGQLQRQTSDVANGDQQLSDDQQGLDKKSSSYRDASDTARELRRLRTALAASERQRVRLESMLLQNTDPNFRASLPVTDRYIYDRGKPGSIELSSPQVIPPSPHTGDTEHPNRIDRENSMNESFSSSCDHSANLNEYTHPQQVSDNIVLIPASNEVADLKDTAPAPDWRELVEGYQEEPTDNPSAEEVKEETPLEPEVQMKTVSQNDAAPVAEVEKAAAEDGIEEDPTVTMQQVDQDAILQKYRMTAVLLLQSVFAEEIATLPDKVLNDPLYDYNQLITRSIEEKKELYTSKLHRLISDARNSEDSGLFKDHGVQELHENFWDTLCIWAVDNSTPIMEATHKLMPKVVDLLKKRTTDKDAQSVMESWLQDFKLHYENSQVSRSELLEAVELLGLYGRDYWSLELILSLLKFLADHVQGAIVAEKPETSDREANTDISHEDFSKLISDIADLLDEKEQLRLSKSEIETDLQSKSAELEATREQIASLETDKTLLQSDNRHLTEAKTALQQRLAQLEEQVQEMQSLDGTSNETVKDLEESNAAYRQRIIELESEIEQLRQRIAELEDTAAISTQPHRLEPVEEESSTALPAEPESESAQPEAEPLTATTDSAREELEYLKQKIAELENASQNQQQTARDQNQYMEKLESEKSRLEEEIGSLNEQLSAKDELSARLENRLSELEDENQKLKSEKILESQMTNGKKVDDEIPEPIIETPPESVEDLPKSDSNDGETPTDNMFWTLSERLASLLDLEIKSQPQHPAPNHDETDPMKTAHEITDKVQELLDRVRRQNEELTTYRSLASARLDDGIKTGELTILSHDPPPYLAPVLANGHAHPVQENIIGDPELISNRRSSNDEDKRDRRSRSGSLRFRRHRSPSPQSHSASHHSARECHACDVLRARRKQQELFQAAKMQANALANRQFDAYPLKIVTFKLPAPPTAEESQNAIRDNDENHNL